ncbi:MAG: L,D-transpeptidase family protein [Salibacteraceae bacterium]|nr:L,D-transpeptidase family protein [Salibacteraceae bacterium]
MKNIKLPLLKARNLFLIGMISVFLIGFKFDGFKSDQLRYSRVRDAYEAKGSMISNHLESLKIDQAKLQIYIRVFKEEDLLEVWGKNQNNTKYQLLKTFEVCASSGSLGPKRQQGDGQVPEGFYHIERFNPTSNFHLSLGVNYPNKSDRILGVRGKLGGDIFIHGSCVTIGCVPLTDEKIEEVYVYGVEAKNAGQTTIPVTFFPSKLDAKKLNELLIKEKPSATTRELWKDLSKAYLYFETSRSLPTIGFLDNGDHSVE